MFASGKFSICRERFQSWDTVSPPSSLLGVEKTGRSRLPGADAGCHPGSSWASVTRPRGGRYLDVWGRPGSGRKCFKITPEAAFLALASLAADAPCLHPRGSGEPGQRGSRDNAST